MKKIKPLSMLLMIVTFLLVIGGWIATTYLFVSYAELPVNLPFKKADETIIASQPYDDVHYPSTGYDISRQWEDVVIYKPKLKVSTVDEIIDIVELPEITESELFNRFKLIDENSLIQFIGTHPDYIENGYEKLFIDLADKQSTPTGIKTIYGDDVLSIDAINGIVIASRTIEAASGNCKVKIALINNKNQIGFSVADHMGYWEMADKHASKNGALLAANANGYTWNEQGSYAVLYGALKINGELIRKANDATQVVTIAEDGTIDAAGNIETAYHAVEMGPILIDDNKVVYSVAEGTTEDRYAQTAIGQTPEGITIIAVAAGSTYGGRIGATNSEMLAIMKEYGASEASMLSGGSRSVMYWNGRVLNETVGYPEAGVRLPSAIIVKPNKQIIDLAEEQKNKAELGLEEPKDNSGDVIEYDDKNTQETEPENSEDSDEIITAEG